MRALVARVAALLGVEERSTSTWRARARRRSRSRPARRPRCWCRRRCWRCRGRRPAGSSAASSGTCAPGRTASRASRARIWACWSRPACARCSPTTAAACCPRTSSTTWRRRSRARCRGATGARSSRRRCRSATAACSTASGGAAGSLHTGHRAALVASGDVLGAFEHIVRTDRRLAAAAASRRRGAAGRGARQRRGGRDDQLRAQRRARGAEPPARARLAAFRTARSGSLSCSPSPRGAGRGRGPPVHPAGRSNLIERRSLPQGRATAVVSRAIGSWTPENSESRPDLGDCQPGAGGLLEAGPGGRGRWIGRDGRAGWIGGRGRARRTGGRRGAGDRDQTRPSRPSARPVRGRGRCAGGDAAAAGYHPVRRLFLRRQPHVLRPLRRRDCPGAPGLSPAARGLRGPRRRLHLRTPRQHGLYGVPGRDRRRRHGD